MEKKNPNIYQRALDIVNSRINPDIPQGGSGGNDDVFVVTFFFDENEEIQCDRTPDEITEAAKDKSVVGLLAMHEGAGVAVQTAVVSVWIPGFAENFQFPVFNQDPDRVSVIEIDYDEDEDAWTMDEFEFEFGGGSGGGLVVNLTGDDEETWASDKTFPEIKQALENGQSIVVKFSVEGKNYIVSGGTLMPAEAEGYELIQFMFGASGGAMNCAGNADEIVWYMG